MFNRGIPSRSFGSVRSSLKSFKHFLVVISFNSFSFLHLALSLFSSDAFFSISHSLSLSSPPRLPFLSGSCLVPTHQIGESFPFLRAIPMHRRVLLDIWYVSLNPMLKLSPVHSIFHSSIHRSLSYFFLAFSFSFISASEVPPSKSNAHSLWMISFANVVIVSMCLKGSPLQENCW